MRRRARLGLTLAAAALALLARVCSPSGSLDSFFPDQTRDAAPNFSPPQAAWRACLVRAADGDSFTARRTDSGREVEVRLYGVDAPERGQPYGRASRRSLLDMTEGRLLHVDPMANDSYGRTVAVVYADDNPASVNERQIERGMAWYYGRYCRQPFCAAWKDKEHRARAEGAGLWRDKNPVSPRRWRMEYQRAPGAGREFSAR